MEKWIKTDRKVDYQSNEWCVMYVDECGDKQIMLFDTIEQAQSYFDNINCCRIGIVTTNFYNHYIAR